MTPTATKRKSPDDQPQDEQSVKRAKLDASNVPKAVQDEGAAEEQQPPTPNPPPAESVAKRPKIKKLTPSRPFPTVPASASATGPRSAHSEGKNYICITRRTPIAAYLRRCKDVIVTDGYKSLHLSAMGAAVPICLTLAASLPNILQLGPNEIKTEILTGTVQVRDEIIPEDDDEDISYTDRNKSTVTVTLVVGDGVDGMRPAKRHPLGELKRQKKKNQKRKAEVVLSEPDQDDMDVA
ncbi:hypothetical protein BDM02DRAFT_2874357 [Thelephora ganbajun]|uniref:Uncharacterized protein n=1 Tax=Thelephora ganbajun TaxID=370292 RepID=A0ACB6ZB54_THEGA|nr:hypothetical protein BDM02DRAFT_2874357 [Thelephora ganbajun]